MKLVPFFFQYIDLELFISISTALLVVAALRIYLKQVRSE
jgi:hypothetical protein